MSIAPRVSAAPVVVGWVLTLRAGDAPRAATLAALGGRNELDVGVVRDHWLPVAGATPEPAELHRWLETLPGVAHVEVAFVEVADPVAPVAATPAGRPIPQPFPLSP